MRDEAVGRRRFLLESGKLAGGGWLVLNTPMLLAAGHAAAQQKAATADFENLTPALAAGLAAVADQVIPADDMPGASEAGVVYFIDHVLSGFGADMAAPLNQGMADLDRRATQLDASVDAFSALSFDQQTTVLNEVEKGDFFQMMIFLTHCGMFAMPSWGGNRERLGWALLGFENLHAWQPPFGHYDALVHAGDDHAEG